MSLEKMFSINFESQIWAVFDELKFIFSQNIFYEFVDLWPNI